MARSLADSLRTLLMLAKTGSVQGTPPTARPADATGNRLRAGNPVGTGPSQPPPFQVFVKSVDNVTLTLTLPDGPNTTMGVLMDLVEGRTGIPMSELRLSTGTKPIQAAKPDLTAADYGIQKASTLTLNGSLKGGYGERAAIAETILAGIKRGNVKQDVQQSDGESRARYRYRRAFREDLRAVAARAAGLDVNKADPDHLDALVIEALGAGTCMEFATVVASKIAGA